jgi:hypothetical protein
MHPSVPPTIRSGTRDLPDVPPYVQYLIGVFLTPILAWVELLLLRRILAVSRAHPLVQIATVYDLSAVVEACAG